MLTGQYPNIPTKLAGPIWRQALTWAAQEAQKLPDGEHRIRARDIYANIHTIETQELSACAFEVHKEYIDLHYCIEGGEIIAYAPEGSLHEKSVYDKEKDYALFMPTENCKMTTIMPGGFAIFFPEELHAPKVFNGKDARIRKVVIKIHKNLVV